VTPGADGPAPPLLTPRARAGARRRGRAGALDLFTPGVVPVAVMLSALHLLNFLNYTVLRGYFSPPVTRSVLLVLFALVLLVRHSKHLEFHLRRSWDMYAICFLALASAAYSLDASKTLQYGAWLLLSVYVGTELAARVRSPNDVVAVLCILLLPVSFFTAVVNVTLGPVVLSTGRQYGALGSTHVDTAYAMNFICLFLALRAMPVSTVQLPKWLRLGMWATLIWAGYQAVFGLTRSVWLGVALALGLYTFRKSLNLRSLLGTMFLVTVGLVAIEYIGLDRILPEAVKGRIEVTEQRVEAGYIDPRIEGIQEAYRSALARPQGTGYAVASSHNSYMNLLLNLGWLGAFLAFVAIFRSYSMVARAGFGWLLFFAIGSGPLLVHAFFEVQTWPGAGQLHPVAHMVRAQPVPVRPAVPAAAQAEAGQRWRLAPSASCS
jgi:hypothetical protein